MGALRGPRPSRNRYQDFRRDYRQQRLDDAAESGSRPDTESPDQRRGKRREYVREYLSWLWPHRFAVATVFMLALLTAGELADLHGLVCFDHKATRYSCRQR